MLATAGLLANFSLSNKDRKMAAATNVRSVARAIITRVAIAYFVSMTEEIRMDDVPSGNFAKEEIPEIVGYRRAHHADIPHVWRMMSAKTYDLFGDVEPGQLFERACLSLVQINEKQEVVSYVSLCNFPNVPAVPSQDWLSWITVLYELPGITERNSSFIHLLVWDCRYEKTFFKALMESIFSVAFNFTHVIMVVPPGLATDHVELFKDHAMRISPTDKSESNRVQTLYVSLRDQHCPKLQIRRVVEEDNDDLIPIVDAESKSLRVLYGDFYISEMMRHPGDGNRQLIVAEGEGAATGVMCLNRVVDVDLLNEMFELGPYNALRKTVADESSSSGSSSSSSVLNKTASDNFLPDSARDRDKERFSLAIARTVHSDSDSYDDDYSYDSSDSDGHSARTSGKQSGVKFASRLQTSVYAEVINELPIRSLASSAYDDDDDDYNDEDNLSVSQFLEMTKRDKNSEIPQGELDAFTVELFSMNKNINEQHGRDYLEAAFECFPDLAYCVMLLPSSQPYFPFVDNFARVPLRFDKDFPMALYVAHRSTLLGHLHCREAAQSDQEIIEDFLHAIPKRNVIMEEFDTAMHSTSQTNCQRVAYVCSFTYEQQALPKLAWGRYFAEPHVDQLRIMYNVEEYMAMKNTSRDAHARLLHFILLPAFSACRRFFFRELMRLSSTTAIYYRLYDSETLALTRIRPLVTCLDAMIPIKSRIRIHQPWPQGEESEDCKDQDLFSLFLMNPRLTMMPKRDVNAKIVVVGASDCGVAFAEFLALQSSNMVHFTNLTLVSSHGLPFEQKGSLEHATMVPFKGRYCYAYRKVVPSRVWINVVHGTVSHINRKDKYVTVYGLGNLTYDYLVLTCGLRYHCPQFLRDDREAERRGNSQQTQEAIPLNCFCINDDESAIICLERLKELTNELTTKKFIVLYGRNINCYCTLSTLLELGVPGAWILLVQPRLRHEEKRSDVFNENEEVNEAVAAAIHNNGVKVLSEWNLKNWILESTEIAGDESNQSSIIKSLKLQSKLEKKFVACDALIYFGEKTVPMKTFMAISKAGLVFDGRLVIDPEYRTNDPNIFAAGSVTKYSRKYQTENLQQGFYNSVEVGERLANNLKQKLDSMSYNVEEDKLVDSTSENREQMTLPVFREPIILYCKLPGGFYYLNVRKAGKRVLRAVNIANGTYGDVLITGSASSDSEIGYFRIRFNKYNKIEAITCLSKKEKQNAASRQFSVLMLIFYLLILSPVVFINHHQFYRLKAFRVQDLITLYGKHESMLNNLRIRFLNSLVPDLYAYFAEPWAAALFHDQFDSLRVENRATLLTRTAELAEPLVDCAITAFTKSNWKEMKEEDRRSIESRFEGSVYQKAISSALITFLQAEEELLPMYCNPRKLRRQLMLQDN